MTTIYEHNGKELFRDEPDAYEIEDIRTHYAQFDKQLLTATYTVVPPEKEGEPRKVIFAKKTGTKGSINPVITVLLEAKPAQLDALAILNEFMSGPELPEPTMLLLQAPRIEEALNQLQVVAKRGQRIVELCLQAKPVPAPTPPLGF